MDTSAKKFPVLRGKVPRLLPYLRQVSHQVSTRRRPNLVQAIRMSPRSLMPTITLKVGSMTMMHI